MNINATLIGQLIAFVVFVWFCKSYVWPPLMAAIEERQKKIADGLAASDRAEKDLELAQAKVSEQLKEAKAQAAEIIEQAKKRGNQLVDEETQRGHAEREKIISQGYAEIEAERNRAKEELRKQVAALAIAGAQQILEREIDASAQSDIVEKLVAELCDRRCAMSELTTVARPYAKAAFDFAVEQSAIVKWQEMLSFAAEVSKNETIHDLSTGAMAADKLADLYINVCGDSLDKHGQNLVKVLAENKRLTALPEISALFDLLKADYEKEVEVSVTSAAELTETQQSELSTSLEKRLARKVKLICNVDPALVAGLVVKAGDTVIDGSVKSKLNRLADALQA